MPSASRPLPLPLFPYSQHKDEFPLLVSSRVKRTLASRRRCRALGSILESRELFLFQFSVRSRSTVRREHLKGEAPR